MKKTITLFMLAFVHLTVLADYGTTKIGVGNFWFYLDTQNLKAELTTGSLPYTGNISIPSSFTYANKTYTVNSIGSYAFTNCSSLTSVTIPSSVKSIGKMAFYGCSSLTSITIPNSVETLGASVFQDCTKLKTVTLSSSLKGINVEAFSGCTSLSSITIPNGVLTVGIKAFYNCTNLSSVTLPSTIQDIGEYAFAGCSKLLNVYCNADVVPGVLDVLRFDDIDLDSDFRALVGSEGNGEFSRALLNVVGDAGKGNVPVVLVPGLGVGDGYKVLIGHVLVDQVVKVNVEVVGADFFAG